jgi:hypothetical protein
MNPTTIMLLGIFLIVYGLFAAFGVHFVGSHIIVGVLAFIPGLLILLKRDKP